MKKILLSLLIAASAMAAQAQTRVVVRRPHRTVVVTRPAVIRPVVVARPIVVRPLRRRVVIVH